jgi:uncharacterized protein
MSAEVPNSTPLADLRILVTEWAESSAKDHETLMKVGYLETFNQEDITADSHLDVVLVVEKTEIPMAERGSHWNLASIGVPTQALVFTQPEWEDLMSGGGWLAERMRAHAVWVFER